MKNLQGGFGISEEHEILCAGARGESVKEEGARRIIRAEDGWRRWRDEAQRSGCATLHHGDRGVQAHRRNRQAAGAIAGQSAAGRGTWRVLNFDLGGCLSLREYGLLGVKINTSITHLHGFSSQRW